jgi:hypothetical protein
MTIDYDAHTDYGVCNHCAKAHTYNGWTNYETWNVALWLGNDEGLYNLARSHRTYTDVRDDLRELGQTETPDGVSYNDSGLDIDELNDLIEEFHG